MNGQKPNLSEIVVALDIGTTKVCAIAGRKNEYGKLEILGVGKEESTGVLRGVVSNIEKTVKAISDAVDLPIISALCVERSLSCLTSRRIWFVR